MAEHKITLELNINFKGAENGFGKLLEKIGNLQNQTSGKEEGDVEDTKEQEK